MKVAFVTSHPIQYQVPVFRELTERGQVDLTVLYAQLPGQQQQGDGFNVPFEWDVPLLSGYRYHVLRNTAKRPSVTNYSGCDTPTIGDDIQNGMFDAVVVNGWVVKTCIQALRACRRLKIPCLVRGEANHLRRRPLWKKLAQRMLVQQYSGYLSIGEANRQFYKSYGVSDDRIFACPYCVENSRFAEVAGSVVHRRVARERWGIPEKGVCFLFSGKFEEKKHPLGLLRALEVACSLGVQAHLLMTGDGALRPECEEFVRQRQLPVRFAGFVNQRQMPEVYLATDCLVLPSDAGETWGLVVNEAMASGRPAIVSDLVGCRIDLIEEGVTGQSFPFGDWNALGKLLATLSANPDCLQTMGQSALQHIQQYSPLRAAEGIEQAVASTLGRRSRTGKGVFH